MMPHKSAGSIDQRLTMTPEERARLVRLCARLSGNLDVAEDLAQETLIEAWRHADRLRDADALMPWLAGIARNVCLRWRRSRAREAARLTALSPAGESGPSLPEQLADDIDLETEFERAELANLLGRALGLLPEETRRVLVERYIEESSYAEIAERLGLSEGAVAVRLHRGRSSLRRVLTHDLANDAVWHGVTIPLDASWSETRLWCRYCGRRRLLGQFNRQTGQFVLRCPGCCADNPDVTITEAYAPEHLRGIKGFKSTFWRILDRLDDNYRPTLTQGWAPCQVCGHPAPIEFGTLDDTPPMLHGLHGIIHACKNCGEATTTCLATLSLAVPEGRRFWRKHPKLLTLPEREIEHEGQPAIVVSFQDVTSAARLDVVSARERFDLLRIYRVHDG